VEGGNAGSDWWDWEQVPGHVADGDRSTPACDWWGGERYREDFDRARALGQNAHRLSVEWARLEPREGAWDAAACVYYRRVLGAARERGLVPLVTLHHFTNPRWLAERGGWETVGAVPRFARYVTRVVQELGDLCDFWVTINEPGVYVYCGYNEGKWPPGKRDVRLGGRVLANMVRGHAAAYHAIHRVQPGARVGVAHHLRRFVPANPASGLDRAAAGTRDYLMNRLFLRALVDGRLRPPMSFGERVPEAVGTQDFIGVNYYFGERVAFDGRCPGLLFTRALPSDWPTGAPSFAGDVYAAGLYAFLVEVARYGKPIYVTENGIFDLGDETQARYLVGHVAQVERAIGRGIPVRGYFYWTLVDNFEWAEGYTVRFGLFANDPRTQTRTARPAAAVYGRIAGENGIAAEVLERYGRPVGTGAGEY
jgi:beta-glucosidase